LLCLTDTSLCIYICVLNTLGWQTLNSSGLVSFFFFFVFGNFSVLFLFWVLVFLFLLAKEYLKIGRDHFLTHCVQCVKCYRIFRQTKCNDIHVTHAPCNCLMCRKHRSSLSPRIYYLLLPYVSATGYGHLQGATNFIAVQQTLAYIRQTFGNQALCRCCFQ